MFFLRISVPNERLISGVPVESAGASVLLDAGCVPHTDRWSLANVRGRCGRSAPRAAKPQKADQCSGSSLRWVVFCRHFTGPRARTSNVPGSNTSSRREPSRQGGGRSCLCEYQGQTAGCSLPLALCRGSISICIDTVFRMAQLPISELSAAHNSKRYSACSFCLLSFFVTPDLLSRPSYAAHRFFLCASVHRPPRSQVAYFAITRFSTYPQRPYRTSRML